MYYDLAEAFLHEEQADLPHQVDALPERERDSVCVRERERDSVCV